MAAKDGHGPWPAASGGLYRSSYVDAERTPFWLDSPLRPAARPAFADVAEADLAIVGGGLSGLWAALLAKEREPGRDVILLEQGRIADAASGRNGGFCSSFLTHGVTNGLARFPEEMSTLERLGLENFAAIGATIKRLGIDCAFETGGDLDIAIEAHEVEWLREEALELTALGHEVELLDRDGVEGQLRSPLPAAGLWRKTGGGLVDPARLCWGLTRAAEQAGVRIHEHTAVEALERDGAGVALRTPEGTVSARQALLATSAFPGLVGAIRRRVVPVWDYVLVTEPLNATQRAAIGWPNRQGIGDLANQFHYFRLTADDRILWGGYDAIYDFAGTVDRAHEQRELSFDLLAGHFFALFPQLEGIRFTHRWGGAIDTCSRFFAFHGTALGGRVGYTVGHTGLGVGASRFGAQVALDLLAGRTTEATRLRAIRSKPMPFPPEPLRWGAIELTRNRLAAADRKRGERGLWLRTLDRLGLGFDS
jgi:glycine/D-amino acid oxidase-like deaminating enzyme